MKKLLYFIFLAWSGFVFSQVGIGTELPNSKSILDIVSVNKGVLIPRMTEAQRNAIAPGTSDPSRDGLLIYNTDTDCYNYWSLTEAKWMSMCQATGVCDPSTFSDFSINCGQFPAADSNIYVVGQSVSGNSVNVSVNVTKVGPYYITIISDNGVSYTATGTFTTLGTQNVVVNNASGAPSSATLNFTVRGNGITLCNYTKSASSNFIYNYDCSAPAVVSPTMVQGVNKTGTVTVNIQVAGTGNIPAFTQILNGVTYTFNGITGATSATTSISIAYSGTPTTANTNLPLTSSNGNVCNVTILHPPGAAVFACQTSAGNSATANGTFVQNQTLTNQTVTLIVNVGTIGSYPALTYTGGGMTFTAPAGNFTTTGNNTITLIGTGTPNTSGLVALTPNNSGMCPLTVNVAVGVATFTLSCTGVKVNASYYTNDTKYFREGTALTASDNVVFSINVSVVGTYNVSFTFKGMTFSKSGTFTSTGAQTLTLVGSGTPNEDGIFEDQSVAITSTGGNTSCTLDFYILTDRNYASNTANGTQILMDYDRGNTWTPLYGSSTTGFVSNNATKKPYLAQNELLSLDLSKKPGYANWYNTMYKNVSDLSTTIQFDTWSNTAGYADLASPISNSVATVTAGGRVGSVDAYLSAVYNGQSTAADAGAFAGWNGAFTPERNSGNVSINYNGIWYNYTAVFDSRTTVSDGFLTSSSYFKGKLTFVSASVRASAKPATGPQDGATSGTDLGAP